MSSSKLSSNNQRLDREKASTKRFVTAIENDKFKVKEASSTRPNQPQKQSASKLTTGPSTANSRATNALSSTINSKLTHTDSKVYSKALNISSKTKLKDKVSSELSSKATNSLSQSVREAKTKPVQSYVPQKAANSRLKAKKSENLYVPKTGKIHEVQVNSDTFKKQQFDTIKSLMRSNKLEKNDSSDISSQDSLFEQELFITNNSVEKLKDDQELNDQTENKQNEDENLNSFVTTDDTFSDDFEDYESDFETYQSEVKDDRRSTSAESESEMMQSEESKQLASEWIPNLSKIDVHRRSQNLSTKRQMNIRQEELLEILSLNTVDYHIFSNPPANYEKFIQLFGRKNMKQVYVQTMSMTDQMAQTNCVEQTEKAVQCPSHRSSNDKSCLNLDIFRLIKFLEIGEKIVSDLVLEDHVQIMKSEEVLTNDLQSHTRLVNHYELKSYQNSIKQVLINDRYLIAIQSSTNSYTSPEKSVIQLWQHSNPAKPEYILISYSSITCCTVDNQFKIFSGSSDGSISVWDIREPIHSFKSMLNDDLVERVSSFTTLCTQLHRDHKGSIVSIIYHHFDEDPNTKVNHQILTADEMGIIINWVIVDMDKCDVLLQEISEGMRPGSLVKLNKLNLIHLTKGQLSNDLQLPVNYLACNFKSSFDYFIAAANGYVLRYSNDQYKTSLPVKYHYYLDECLIKAKEIQFHPKYSQMFLSAYEDGSICLFNIKHEIPIRIWTPKETKCSHLEAISWLAVDSLAFMYLSKVNGLSIIDLSSSQELVFLRQTIKNKK